MEINKERAIKEFIPDISNRFLEKIFDPKEIHKEFLIHVTTSIARKVLNAPLLDALRFAGIIDEPTQKCVFCKAKESAHWRKTVYYCHECNANLNAVEFLMTHEKMSFEEAFRTVLESILG